jgi:hybrid cluster-associated redox disulfide protein
MTSTPTLEPITAHSLVQAVIERHPQAVAVFVRHRLQCAGCCISPFHTIADSAREYAVALEPLLRDLNQAVASGTTPAPVHGS